MSIDDPEELAAMKRAGVVVKETIQALRQHLVPGVTTGQLDAVAKGVFDRHGARSAPTLEYDFPGTVLISVNDEAVHGIPGERVILAHDLVKLDVTPELDGFVADAAVTVAMPQASAEAKRLARCAEHALERAIAAVKVGRPINELGRVVEREVERQGFHVLRELGGHGVGRTIHQPPDVLNFYDPRNTASMTEGLTFTIEPIIASGTRRIYTDSDGWTIRTRDGSLSAHYEHTLVVTKGKPLVLTA